MGAVGQGEGVRAGRRLRVWRWVFYALAVLAISCAFAVERAATVSYNPVNGDFQSYNVLRRLLAGQLPVRDFANYIGMAPIYINLPLVALGGGSFAASLFVTNFTCNLLFSLCLLLVFWLVTENTAFSMVASACFSKLVGSGLLTLLGAPGRYLSTLYENLYTPSNSMRIARIFWPFLLVFLFIAFDFAYHKRHGRHFDLVRAAGGLRFCGALGALVGLGVTWSNDFGLGAAFCATLLLVLLLCLGRRGAAQGEDESKTEGGGRSLRGRQPQVESRTESFAVREATRKVGPEGNDHRLAAKAAPTLWALKRLGLYLLCLLAGAVVAATVAGGGNPLAFLRSTAGVGGYQYFYFNGTGGKALLPYIFTNGRLLCYTAGYLLFLDCCLWRLIRGRLDTRTLLGGFLALCVLVASYAYILSGSGYNFTEALEGFFWLGVLALAARLVLHGLRRFQKQVALACTALLTAAALGFTFLAGREVLRPEAALPGGIHSAALGGWAPYPKALGEAAALTEGEAVFSVYATGLEVEKGQFQPSGYDYIIHALGDDARAAYLESFTEGEYPWVQTTCLGLENWLSVENWDFYRLVGARYTRVLKTEYSWLWQRAGADLTLDAEALGAEVTLTEEGGRWRVTVTADPGTDFTADVRLGYDTAFKSAGGAALSLGRRCVVVSTQSPVEAGASAGAYLPAQSDALYIPVAVVDGTGSATIAPRDGKYVSLWVHTAELAAALPDMRTP